MTTEDLLGFIQTGYGTAVEKITATADLSEIDTYLKELDPKQSPVFDRALRPDKVIKNEEGNSTSIPVARIAIALQKLIVSRAAAFLVGNPIEIAGVAQDGAETDLLAAVNKTWEDNKLDYKSKRLAKLMMSETACAELWYTQEAEPEYWAGTQSASAKFKLRVRILAHSLGDNLYPVYSPEGDMIAFGRGYNVKDADGKEIEHFDLYTPDKTYLAEKQDGWVVDEKPNMTKKIPIIYYSQPDTEWSDVQEMITRLSVVISNNSDTNDYFGNPMIIVEGGIKGFAQKGETGKLLEMEDGGKVSYLTWDQAPTAVKMEIDNLLRFIYTGTDTPDISFEQMKSIGGNAPSGFALKMMFLGAHLKASEKEEIFGESIQRRLNYLKAALAIIDGKLANGLTLNIRPKFEYFLPKNDAERIDIINSAVGGGIMSAETGIEQNPLIEDAPAEIERVKQGGLDQLQNNIP